jgi:hypothetical protein
MPLTEYDRAKLKSDQDFQAKVVKILDRAYPQPQKPSLSKHILDSGFIKWAAAYLFLTVGGFYISQHRECMSKADTDISTVEYVLHELSVRQTHVLDGIASATTIQGVKGAIVDKSGFGETYNKISTEEMIRKAASILGPDYDQGDSTLIPSGDKSMTQEQNELEQRQLDLQKDVYYGTLRFGDFDKITVEQAKAWADEVSLQFLEATYTTAWVGFAPTCSVKSIFLRDVVGDPLPYAEQKDFPYQDKLTP